MDIFDRYLGEVGRYLPPAGRNDILAEISEALHCDAEERERELGRPLTEDEAATLVKAYGYPKIVAARYGPQQYLIGPDLFPFYFSTTRLVLAIVLGLELASATVAALLDHASLATFLRGVSPTVSVIFWTFGVVTLVFAAIERTSAKAGVFRALGIDKWDPRALPATQEEIPRLRTLVDLFFNLAALFWLLDVPYVRYLFGFLTIGPPIGYVPSFAFAPAWQLFFIPFLAGTATIVAVDVALLFRPYWVRVRAASLLGANLLFVLGAALVLPAHQYLVVTRSIPQATELLALLDKLTYYCLISFLAVCAIAAAFNLRTLLRRRRAPFVPIAARQASTPAIGA
jgi:hypothetical protein